MKKALTKLKIPTGASVTKKLQSALAGLEADQPEAWDAAKRLSMVQRGAALEPYADILRERVAKLDDGLDGFAAFPPASPLIVHLLTDGPAARTSQGESMVHLALATSPHTIEGGIEHRNAMTRLLLDRGADWHAIDATGTSVLRALLYWTRDWDLETIRKATSPETVNAPYEHGPLATAAGRTSGMKDAAREIGHKVIDYLVEAGADLAAPGVVGALCSAGRLDLVKLAVSRGVDLTATARGRTALHAAVASDRSEITQYLLDQGVPPNSGNSGNRPIHGVRSVAVFDILAAAGADVADPDSFAGTTALHNVASNFQVPASEMAALVERFETHGILRSSPNKQGQTPAELLAQRHEPEIQALAQA